MSAILADNYQLKWHSHGNCLHTSVASLHRSESFTDVTLATADGHYIPAHRFILSACSTYFQQLLQISTNNSQLIIVLPSEINYRTLLTLLEYMYSGEATVSNDLLNGVLKVGETLKVKGLCMADKDKYARTNTTENNKDDFLKLQHRKLGGNIKTYKAPDRSAQKGVPKVDGEGGSECDPQLNGNSIRIKKSSITDRINKYMDSIESIQIKEEPQDWAEQDILDAEDMIETHMVVQPEIYPNSMEDQIDEGEEEEENFYVPLTCDMCQETFKTPALWVRHVDSHPANIVPHRKRRKDGFGEDDEEYPSLRCELCQEVYRDPGDWVRHIQATHTEEQLALSNSSSREKPKEKVEKKPSLSALRRRVFNKIVCPVCYKSFPSAASMLIHARTHTGEKPYLCRVCMKGFNVKSNLLRHMRTVHESLFSSAPQTSEEM